MSSVPPSLTLTTLLVLSVACGSAEGDGGLAAIAGGGAGGIGAGLTGGAAHGGRAGAPPSSGGAAGGGSVGPAGGATPAGSSQGGAARAGESSGGASPVGGGAGGVSFGGTGSGGSSGAGGASGAGGTSGSGGGTSVVFPPSCTCMGMGPPSCVATGNISFTLAQSASPTADERSAYEAITCAMSGAVAYYNCNTTISKKLSISYVPSVSTADGNINGSIRFGSDRSYMACATSMHEIGHTLGVGTAPNWSKLSVDGLFEGEAAIAQLRAITGKPDEVLHSDTQHFWPYGLNYASEAKSTADLVGHALIVAAMRKDLGL